MPPAQPAGVDAGVPVERQKTAKEMEVKVKGGLPQAFPFWKAAAEAAMLHQQAAMDSMDMMELDSLNNALLAVDLGRSYSVRSKK